MSASAIRMCLDRMEHLLLLGPAGDVVVESGVAPPPAAASLA